MVDFAKILAETPEERERRRLKIEAEQAARGTAWRDTVARLDRLADTDDDRPPWAKLTPWERQFIQRTGAYLRAYGFFDEFQEEHAAKILERLG